MSYHIPLPPNPSHPHFCPDLQVIDPSMGHLHIPRTSEHRELLQRSAAQHSKEISSMLLKMPRPLLLLLKTNGGWSQGSREQDLKRGGAADQRG